MIHRIQLSMITEDDDLYLNFIQPLKDNKELTPTILKLLEMYYRIPEVQQIIDYSSLEDVSVDVGDSESYDEALSRAKETLAMMSLMADSASDIMTTGAVSIEEIIKHGTKIREESGVSEPATGNFKAIEMSSEPADPVSAEQGVNTSNSKPSMDAERLSKLETDVDTMKGMLQQILTMVSGGSVSVRVQPEPEITDNNESDLVENSVESVEQPVETVDNSEVVDEAEEIALFGTVISNVQPAVDEDDLNDDTSDDIIPKIKTPLPQVKVDTYEEESTEDVLARASKLLGDSTETIEVVDNSSVGGESSGSNSDDSAEESSHSESKDGTSSLLSFLSSL